MEKIGLPGVEFEGPLGMFWVLEEVPFEAMVNGTAEIIRELLRRGYKEEIILESIKSKMIKEACVPDKPI